MIYILLLLRRFSVNYSVHTGICNRPTVSSTRLKTLCVTWGKNIALLIIFWDFLIFDKIFLSAHVKRIVIISNKHGILRVTEQRLAPKITILSILAKNSSKIEIELFPQVPFHTKTTVCPEYPGQDRSPRKYIAQAAIKRPC